MKIEIVGFKCYSSFTVEISDGSVNLLKGPSGIGKSTILQAITWALYGTLRGVSPSSGKKGKLSVRLTTPYIIVYRQKGPGLLQVTKGNQMYEDAVGQTIINEMFCGADLWPSVAYMSQGCRNALLSSSNNDKMDLLNQVAFHGQNVEAYILKADQAATQAKVEFETLQSQLIKDVETFKRQFESAKLDIKDAMSVDDLAKLELELKFKQQQIVELRSQSDIQQQKIGQLTMLKSSLASAEKDYADSSIVDMTDYSSEIASLEKDLAVERNREGLMDQISKLIVPDVLPSYTEEELIKMREEVSTYSKHSLMAKDRGFKYDREILDAEINRLKMKLSKQPYLSLMRQVKQLEEQVSKISEETIKHEEIEAAENYLASLYGGLNVLTCPHCSSSVRYVGSKLVKDTEKPTSNDEVTAAKFRLSELKARWTRFNQRLGLLKQIELLKVNIPNDVVYEDPMGSQQIKLVEDQIKLLSSIVIYPEPPLSWLSIEYDLNMIANNRRLVRCNEELKALPQRSLSSFEILTKLNDRRLSQARTLRAKATLEQANILIDRINLSIKTIVIDTGLDSRLKMEELSINDMTGRINRARLTNLYLSQHRELENRQLEIQRKYLRWTHLLTLKAKMIEVECQVLQSTVDNINSILGEIVNGLFDEPITIALRLFKQNKTTERVRPVVNISISYKGAEFDNVNQLSGGEGDRVSLALTLALNRVSGCPLVLLDESMSSLDGGVKEMCIHQIQNNTPGRTVICVNHEGVEGHYDHVISLG